jgi:hypothetical protein
MLIQPEYLAFIRLMWYSRIDMIHGTISSSFSVTKTGNNIFQNGNEFLM